MDGLIVWLRAQFDDDERKTRTLHIRSCGHDAVDPDAACDCDWHVSRMLCEVEAKRRIIDAVERFLQPHPGQPCTNEHAPWDECGLARMETAVTPYALRLLALPYADRPGYRQEWAR